MGRLFGGLGLIGLALFMLIGFFAADVGGMAAIIALGITVVLPGVAGAALIRRHLRGGTGLSERRNDLRQQTLEAELLRLSGVKGGKLTIVEAVSELAITPEEAKHALDELSRRGLADFEVTDSGVIVYAFHDVQHLSEKSKAKGILE